MSRSSYVHPGLVAFVAVLALVAMSPQSSAIRGRVTIIRGGNPQRSVEVTARSEGVWRTVHTDDAGRFEFSGLRSGTYELRAELVGFRTAIQSNIQVPKGGTVIIDLTMEPRRILSTLMWVIPEGGLPGAYRSTDAIVHLRITRSMAAKAWPRDRGEMNSVVGTEHLAIVLDVLKLAPAQGPRHCSELRFVQYPAGVWTDGTRRAEGIEDPYSPGNEYVAFLEWDSSFERFTRYVGPTFMFPVRDGQVFWKRDDLPDVPGLRNGMTVESFFAILRTLESKER